MIYPAPGTARLECKMTIYGILGPLGFDFLLIALCTFYAVNTRNVPANFNEAKYIGFAMYTTCVIWIAFVPLYFGSNNKVKHYPNTLNYPKIALFVHFKFFALIFYLEINKTPHESVSLTTVSMML